MNVTPKDLFPAADEDEIVIIGNSDDDFFLIRELPNQFSSYTYQVDDSIGSSAIGVAWEQEFEEKWMRTVDMHIHEASRREGFFPRYMEEANKWRRAIVSCDGYVVTPDSFEAYMENLSYQRLENFPKSCSDFCNKPCCSFLSSPTLFPLDPRLVRRIDGDNSFNIAKVLTSVHPMQKEEMKVVQKEKTKMKMYWCRMQGCSKGFHKKTHLQIHARVHNEARPSINMMSARKPKHIRLRHQQDLQTERKIGNDEHRSLKPSWADMMTAGILDQAPFQELVVFLKALIEAEKPEPLLINDTFSRSSDELGEHLEWGQAMRDTEAQVEFCLQIVNENIHSLQSLNEKIQGIRRLVDGSLMPLHEALGPNSMSPSWSRKTACGLRVPKNMALPLAGLAVCVPCAALMNGSSWPGSARSIVGVISGSSGLALTSLPTENDYDALRWLIRLLWAVTYGAFLRCSYLSLRDNKPIYLFCSLLLAGHFAFGFAGSADTTEEATKGILMFGPLVATCCAGLVYIPFRYRTPRSSRRSGVSASVEDVEMAHSELSDSDDDAATQHSDSGGDIGVEWRVMQGIIGQSV